MPTDPDQAAAERIVDQIDGLAHRRHSCDETGCGYVSQARDVIADALRAEREQERSTHLAQEAKWHQAGYADGQRAEREACAKVADNLQDKKVYRGDKTSGFLDYAEPKDVATAIRARGGEG